MRTVTISSWPALLVVALLAIIGERIPHLTMLCQVYVRAACNDRPMSTVSSTCDVIVASEPSSPPGQPSRQIDLRPPEVMLLRLHSASMTAQPLTAATVMMIDEEGCVVVADVIGAVYGAGASESEARSDFEVALDDHLRFLRARSDKLRPRLVRQLSVLERLFPDR